MCAFCENDSETIQHVIISLEKFMNIFYKTTPATQGSNADTYYRFFQKWLKEKLGVGLSKYLDKLKQASFIDLQNGGGLGETPSKCINFTFPDFILWKLWLGGVGGGEGVDRISLNHFYS